MSFKIRLLARSIQHTVLWVLTDEKLISKLIMKLIMVPWNR